MLLVVIDTLRADAVSAYGQVSDTTPNLDALAAGGLLYRHARATAPETVPSHASLFTGLDALRHGVGTSDRVVAPDGLVTLAERLAAAGYRTAGFSENPLVSDSFGLAQGFARFRAQSVEQLVATLASPGRPAFDPVAEVEEWSRGLPGDRPFFLFVNLLDPHLPYQPPGARERWAALDQSPDRICDALPSGEELEQLRRLYRDEVRAADERLARVHAIARRTAGRRPLVTVVTSDHGELLGERRLLDHQFTLHGATLHVPLVVHGLPGVAPAALDVPVSVADVAPSILTWAGVAWAEALDGLPLPTRPEPTGSPRPLFAAYADRAVVDWPVDVPRLGTPTERARRRRHCGPGDRVFGDMASVVRGPFKLVWFERGPPELYDLRWDPDERTDLAATRPELAAELGEQLRARQASPAGVPEAEDDPRRREAERALRALGYAD